MAGIGRLVLLALATVGALVAAAPVGAAPERTMVADAYVVLYADGASLASARMAVRAAGGTLVRENRAVGVATATSLNPRFAADVRRQGGIAGVVRDRAIGRSEPARRWKGGAVERLARAAGPAVRVDAGPTPAADPLAGLQWGMAMIHATADGSYRREPGDKGVLVGILDSGIDASHPDIAANFDAARSRNFATDIPLIDGPCEVPSCVDPPNVDDNGHGTHVAGIVGAALNGLGVAGVAPNVTLANIRVGQDAGFIFLQPAVDALTYAGDIGVDVVNMSFYIDPWLFNCASNPADSPEQQAEQRAVVEATNRALHYAKSRGVTLIGSEGNEHTNLDSPTSDNTSPDFPPNTAHPRTVDNSCSVMPTEGKGVLSIAAVGPSTTKADYSNWGLEQTEVAAPGGYQRDLFGTPQYRAVTNLVLSSYPERLLREAGLLNPDGSPRTTSVVRNCVGATCGYYAYLQGTSMASPHAAGVAALIVSRWGKKDKEHGGLTLDAHETEQILRRTATPHACPDPPVLDYTQAGRPASYTAVCEGKTSFNSIWGHGIVDALTAVTKRNG